MEDYSEEEARKLIHEAENEAKLEVTYEVVDSPPPSSGTFDVHLKKTSTLSLGIMIDGLLYGTFWCDLSCNCDFSIGSNIRKSQN